MDAVRPNQLVQTGSYPRPSKRRKPASFMRGDAPWVSRGKLDSVLAQKSPAHICCTEPDGNCRNLLCHTLHHQPYVGLKLMFLLWGIPVDTIIPLFRKLSIHLNSLFLPKDSRMGVSLVLNCLALVVTVWHFGVKTGFGRLYLILPQNKAKICPIIVTMPTGCGEPVQQSSVLQLLISE